MHAQASAWSAAAVVCLLLALLPSSAGAATCASYATQAAAQAAGDTRDGDGDGRYCESLPCPCAGPGAPAKAPAPAGRTPAPACRRPAKVVALRFSAARYPNVRRHVRSAIAQGWPRVLVLNRPGAGQRRDRLLQTLPPKEGFDRDEYPPAIGRGRANGDLGGLVQGASPGGWKADVAYVPSAENRSQGAAMGARLSPYCTGTRFRLVFTASSR